LKSRHEKSRNAKWKNRKRRPLKHRHNDGNLRRYQRDREWLKRSLLAQLYGVGPLKFITFGRGYGKSYLHQATVASAHTAGRGMDLNAQQLQMYAQLMSQSTLDFKAVSKIFIEAFKTMPVTLMQQFQVFADRLQTDLQPPEFEEPTSAPDIVGTVSGYRVFYVDSLRGHVLRSIARDFLWVPGVNKALLCDIGDLSVLGDRTGQPLPHPQPYCGCGFWGLNRAAYVPRFPRLEYHPPCPDCEGGTTWINGYVLGRIEGWGIVVEAERGFRSQFARITELWAWDYRLGDGGAVEEFTTSLGLRYGVPIHRMTESLSLDNI